MLKHESLPTDFVAISPERQGSTPMSFSVSAGVANGQLNSDYFRVVSFEGKEQVSQPYSFTITLRANEDNTLSLAEQSPHSNFANLPKQAYSSTQTLSLVQGTAQSLLGQWGQVVLGFESYPDMDTQPALMPIPNLQTSGSVSSAAETNLPIRHFSGIVSSVSQSAPGEYTAVLQSPLFPLTLRNKYYVYKSLNLQGAIAALLSPELSRYGNSLSVQYNITGLAASRVQDWMQAGETDFDMLQRLMKKAAIYFYFIHAQSGLTVVFSNQPTSPNAVAIPGSNTGDLSLRYSYTDAKSLGLQQNDLLCNLRYQVQMTSQTVGTVLACQEAVWETNEVASYDSFPATAETTESNYVFYKNYSYGVDKEESQESNLQLAQQIATEQGTLTGECTSNLLSPGYTFTLTQVAINPRDATAENLMPSQFDGETFVVTSITHKVTDSTPYTGEIEATSVSVSTKQPDSTLIAPFSIHDTHQGNVLATVLESAVPKNSYFFEKGNFQTELSSVEFDGAQQSQIGCIVKFATDEGNDVTHWVALSESSQSAPAVHSMVMVGRGGNDSEIPQIQQVISSHGQKTIQPIFTPKNTLWRQNNWTFNTNWGSNCSTSYGDSKSIHFDGETTPDLKTTMNIVQTAYGNPTVMGAKFGGVSFNEGCSFSYSTTGKGAKGLASASVSQGCHFSESYSDHDYSVSYNNTRQSFSKSNKSVNVSYQGAFTDTVDEQNLNFINGKIPNQEIIDICNGLPDGSSLNQNHITGKTINLSGTRTEPPSTDSYDESADVYSHSKTTGKVVNKSEQTGDTFNESTTIGDTHNTSSQTGDSESTNTHTGNSSNTTTTTGYTKNKSTTEGDSSSDTYITGNANNYSKTIGATNQNDIFIGARNNLTTSVAATNTANTFVGATNDVTTKLAISNSINTNIGPSNTVSMNLGISNTTSANLSASNTTSMNMSASNALSVNIGASMSLSANLAGNLSLSATEGTDLSVSTRGGLAISVDNNAGVKIQLATGTAVIDKQVDVKAEQKGIVASMVSMVATL